MAPDKVRRETGAAATRSFGREAEERAAAYLEKLGYRVLQRNYRCRGGEIDLVALDGATLVFVEVKARHSDHFGTSGEAIGRRKAHHLRVAAATYLTVQGAMAGSIWEQPPCRFDAVLFDEDTVEHLKDVL